MSALSRSITRLFQINRLLAAISGIFVVADSDVHGAGSCQIGYPVPRNREDDG
jgi:hypothetical protein